ARESVGGRTQAVLDIRRATAWLGGQAEVDDRHLGVFGISLGAITGALAAECEPRLQNVFLVMAGGDIGKVAGNSPYAAMAQKKWRGNRRRLGSPAHGPPPGEPARPRRRPPAGRSGRLRAKPQGPARGNGQCPL